MRAPSPAPSAGLSLVRRRLLALVAMAIGSVAVAAGVVWQYRHDAQSTASKAQAERLFGWEAADAITRIDLTSSHGHFVIQRSDAVGVPWRLEAPQAVAGDGGSIDTLLGAALGGSQKALVAHGGDAEGANKDREVIDWALFGLAAPRITLTLTGPDGQQQSLRVGASSSFDDTVFVRRGDRNEVVAAASTLTQALDRSLFDLRDKRVLHLPSSRYQQVVVTPDSGPGYTLAQQGDDLRLTAPISAFADRTQAEALTGALSGLRASAFVAEKADDAAARRTWGLAKPLYTVEITDDTGARGSLRLGRITGGPDAALYAQANGAGPVVQVAGDWVVKKLSIGLWELRDKRVARVQPDQVQRLEVSESGRRLALTRHPEAGWQFDGDGARAADGDKVMRVVKSLCDLEAEGVAAEQASAEALAAARVDANDALEVVLEGAEGKALATVRAAPERNGERLLGSIAGAPLWRVGPAGLAQVAVAAEAYQPTASPPASHAAHDAAAGAEPATPPAP